MGVRFRAILISQATDDGGVGPPRREGPAAMRESLCMGW